METKQTRKRQLLIFLVITFALTALYEFLLVTPALTNPATASVGTLLMASCMFLPTVGMLLTRLVTKQGFGGMWLRPNLRGNAKAYLGAWLLPPLLTLVGAVVYFLIFPGKLDWNMGYLAEQYVASGQPFDPAAARATIVIQILVGLLIAPLLNFFTCLGEEWGWRGYMMPRLAEQFSFAPACLIGGVLWGLWHAPLTMLGHNYGVGYAGWPFAGIAMMCVFCITTGTLFSYLSLRARSCLPAVIGHAMLNALAASAYFFTPSATDINPFVGPAPIGIIGMAGFIVATAVCIWLAHKHPLPESFPAPVLATEPATPETMPETTL